jgi:hypothetical protein
MSPSKKEKIFTEEDYRNFFEFTNELWRVNDLQKIANLVDETIKDLTMFDYTLILLYDEKNHVFYGTGPISQSPIIRKAEKMMGMFATDIQVDLNENAHMKRILVDPRVRIYDEKGTLDNLISITKHSKTAIGLLQRLLGIKSSMTAPMIIKQGPLEKKVIIGCIAGSSKMREITAKERKKFTAIVNHSAMAFHSALLSKKQASQLQISDKIRKNLELLNEVNLEIQTVFNDAELYRTISEKMRERGFSFTMINLENDGKTGTVNHYAPPMQKKSMYRETLGFSLDDITFQIKDAPVLMEVLERKEPRYCEKFKEIKEKILDAIGVKGKKRKMILSSMPNEREVVCPLVLNNEIKALVIFSGVDVDEYDLPTFDIFTNQLASAFERVRLINEIQSKHAEEKKVGQIREKLQAIMDVEQIYTLLIAEMGKLIEFDMLKFGVVASNATEMVLHTYSITGKGGSAREKTSIRLGAKLEQNLIRSRSIIKEKISKKKNIFE